jgi:uncharacterized protein
MDDAPIIKDPAINDRVVEDHMILRTLVGSTVHGLELEGTDDRDEMGIVIPPPDYVLGHRRFEHWVQRTAPEGERSGPGDLDLVVYSLRKYVRMAASGSPTVMLPMFASGDDVLVTTELGDRLRGLAPAFLSRRIAASFLGYMRAQRERLDGSRGGMKVRREHLIGKYGFDTKYAMHTLRLGYQGLEVLDSGRITLPMAEPTREHIRLVRVGEVELDDVLAEAHDLEARLSAHAESSELPDEPDWRQIDDFVVGAHLSWWRGEGR